MATLFLHNNVISFSFQVFHLCDENGQRNSFLCPVGTIFNQKYLVCDWWYNVDCEGSSKFINAETLQAYSTTNEKQKVITMIDPVKKEPTSTKQEKESKILSRLEYEKSYDQGRNRKQTMKENHTQKKLPNLSQKAVNYPIGYAILLREYMKNSASNHKINRDENNFYRNDKKSIRNTDFKFENRPTSDKKENFSKYIAPEKTYSKIVQYPIKKDIPNTNKGYPKFYINVSLSHTQNNSQRQKKPPKIENKHSSYTGKSYIPILNVNADISKVILGTSGEKNADSKKKEFLVEKEKTDKNTDSTIRKTFQKLQENTHTNSKHLFKSTKDLTRYHFIIDPKEAIKPAPGKQFSMLQEQIKNNSAIKFRHAESTLKHIKPYNSKSSPFINMHNSSKVFIKPKEFSHVEYSSSASFLDDHLILNSAPRALKTLNPAQNLNIRFGDRLSKHTRSVSLFNEKVNQENKVKHFVSSYELQNQIYANKTNEMKRKNDTYASDLQQSETRFDFPNFSNYSNTLNNSKEQKLNLENMTTFSDAKNDGGISDEDSLMNKQKITISVHIETKAVINNNESILSNENIPIIIPENNILSNIHLNNQSSLFSLNPNYNSTSSAKDKLLQNLSFSENLNGMTNKLNSKNVTKINNSHGGYLLVKQAAHKDNNTVVNHPKRKETYTSTIQKRTLNGTMWYMPFSSSF